MSPQVPPGEADWIILPTHQRDRGGMATQLLEAADRLGLEQHQVRTVSEGFKVPRAIAADLFPSLFPDS